MQEYRPYQKRVVLASFTSTDQTASSLGSNIERKKQAVRAWEGNNPSRK